MESPTFQKEITFLSPTAFNEKTKKFEEAEISKVATFKELSRLDRSQHDLHFMIMNAFNQTKGNDFHLDTTNFMKMTDMFIENALMTKDDEPTTEITQNDKIQFLNDSIGKLAFGMWLFKEKFTPFFQKLVSYIAK